MRKITYLLLISTFALPFIAAAGEEKYEDVIYLKDGSIIRGTLIERIPGETYKIEIEGGSVFIFTADEVEKITREPRFAKTEDRAYGYRSFLFGFQPLLGFPLGHGVILYGGEFKVGYRATDLYAVGLGFGYNRFSDYSVIPIDVHNRFTYRRTPSTGMYVYLDIGYSLIYGDWSRGQFGGALFEFGHGTEVGGPKFHGDVSIGLRSQVHGYGFSLGTLILKFGFSI